jgi:hypothetical protein
MSDTRQHVHELDQLDAGQLAQNHRVFFRAQSDSLEISRVLDRKQAYR